MPIENEGWRPPAWVKSDRTLWMVGWAREEKRGMEEALEDKKKAPPPDLTADVEATRRDHDLADPTPQRRRSKRVQPKQETTGPKKPMTVTDLWWWTGESPGD